MNAHTLPAKLRPIRDVVAEYDAKLAAIPDAIRIFEEAGHAIKAAACVGGTWGREDIKTGHVYDHSLRLSLLRSAWLHVWDGLNLSAIASAEDKRKWDAAMANPAPFTLDNIAATLGRYIEDPRASILRGLAEVFSGLDPAYKSHEKVKIGVKGLPKRVILTNIGSYSSYGEDKMRDIINALASYQGKPLITQPEVSLILKDGDALREGGTFPHPWNSRHEAKTLAVIGRGIWLKRFQNGNGHLFFSPDALADINRALAEFYGDVLADCPDDDAERPKPRASTAVSKDLQFYPTPRAVIDRLIRGLHYRLSGKSVLEPSCGDGRLMEALKLHGAGIVHGIEVDPVRAQAARNRAGGLHVQTANFLEVPPTPTFDLVVMNPPFYGRHYAKHVRHALKFLKPGGHLYAILPATARYDHGELDDLEPDWSDLPVGAFAESGTNICTTIATISTRRA